jgi:hypothetical protein
VRRAVLALFATALVVAGCGGDSPSSPATTAAQASPAGTTATAPPATTTVPVTPSGVTTPIDLSGPIVQRTPASAPKTDPAPTLLFIGDSLAVGTAPLLPDLLPDWNIEVDAQGARVTGTSMQIFRSHEDPIDVVAFSAFTADPPQALDVLESSVRESVERVYAKCAVWATLYADPVSGENFDAANALLYKLADEYPGKLLIVPWAETVKQRPELLSDGVHGTAEGFKVRAQLYADAARRCIGES